MKKSIVTFAFLLTGLFVASTLFMNCGGKKAEQETKQAESEDHADHKMDSTMTAYACPMHPEEKGKEGDKCSKCGMMLEAMKSADSTAAHQH